MLIKDWRIQRYTYVQLNFLGEDMALEQIFRLFIEGTRSKEARKSLAKQLILPQTTDHRCYHQQHKHVQTSEEGGCIVAINKRPRMALQLVLQMIHFFHQIPFHDFFFRTAQRVYIFGKMTLHLGKQRCILCRMLNSHKLSDMALSAIAIYSQFYLIWPWLSLCRVQILLK